MRWGYKTVHFSLKKDGILGNSFLDEAEIEVTLNEYGKSGWELVSFMEVNDGLIAVFKQPFGHGLPSFDEETTVQEETPVSKKEEEIVDVIAPMEIKPPITSVQQEEEVEKKSDNNVSVSSDVGAIRID